MNPELESVNNNLGAYHPRGPRGRAQARPVGRALYASPSDLPVHLSAMLRAAPRAGYYELYTVVPGVDTLAMPDFDLDLIGHSYSAQTEALPYHIRDLMLNGKATIAANRLAPAMDAGGTFWRLKR